MTTTTAPEAWRRAWRLLTATPSLAVPFAVAGAVEILALLFLSLGPVRPFSVLLAPPVRAFFGAEFLRYPAYSFVLPRLFGGVQTFLSLSIGPWALGATVARVRAAAGKGAAPARYPALFAVGIASYLVVRGGAAVVPFLLRAVRSAMGAAGWSPSRTFWGVCVVSMDFAVGFLVEFFFAYAAAFLLIGGRAMENAVEGSFALAWRRRRVLAPVVLLPGFAYFLWAFLRDAFGDAWAAGSPATVFGLTAVTIGAAFLANLGVTLPATADFLSLPETLP
jgi:hypothetical protein